MKERIAKFIAGLSLLAVFGCGMYQALQPATAQTGGGVPSNLRLQTLGVGIAPNTANLGSITSSGSANIGGNENVQGVARLNCSGVLADPLTVCQSADHTTKILQVTNTPDVLINGIATQFKTGTSTAQLSTCVSGGSGTAHWTQIGTSVTVQVPFVSCTSNGTNLFITLASIPAPATTQSLGFSPFCENNTVTNLWCTYTIAATNNVVFTVYSAYNVTAGIISSGTKAVSGFTFTYDTN